MKEKGITSLEDKIEYLNKCILVKADKHHRCYNFHDLFENLVEMPAGDFATAIKGRPENLGCDSAFDLLFKVRTRFNSIESFRT